MAKSERQKSLKRRMLIFGILSFSIWIITSLVMVGLAIKHCFPTPQPTEIGETIEEGMSIFSEELKAKVMSLSITVGIGLIGTIIIKDKIRVFMWICCVIIAALLYGNNGMFVIFAIWLIDEYILRVLYKYYKRKWEIRKEIDY